MKTKSLEELEDKYVGRRGSEERNRYEKELSDLMIGQQNLTVKTLRDIVEFGLGGTLKVEVTL